MGERDKDGGRDFGGSSVDRDTAAREHERKLRMLKRLSDALGRPIEDFFKATSEADNSKDEPSDGGRD